MTVLTTLARLARGETKNPSSSAAVSKSRPVTKIAEHRIFANPAVSCSSQSPGGTCHLVGSSGGEAALTGTDASTAAPNARRPRRRLVALSLGLSQKSLCCIVDRSPTRNLHQPPLP